MGKFFKNHIPLFLVLAGLLLVFGAGFAYSVTQRHCCTPFDQTISKNTENMMEEGQKTFRYDTFGDEVFWGDALHLHQAIEGKKFGGVGPGVSPAAALEVGLKVDENALPSKLNRPAQGR